MTTEKQDIGRINRIFKDIGIKCNGSTKLWINESSIVIQIYKEALQHLTDLHKKQIRQKEATHQKEMSIERERIKSRIFLLLKKYLLQKYLIKGGNILKNFTKFYLQNLNLKVTDVKTSAKGEK